MTAVAMKGLDIPSRKALRLCAAFICALGLHVAIIGAAMLWLRTEAPEDGGLLALDMPPLAVENALSAADNSEVAQDATSAPPPSDRDDPLPPDQPPEAQAKPEALEPPEEPIVEKAEAPEAQPEPVQETVPEAPQAIEPEVVLPKAIEEPKALEKPEEVEPERKSQDKQPVERKPDTDKGKAKSSGPKSSSKAASSAAASGGKFSPNAISRPHPPYPSSARASRIEGSVVVRYTVSPSGSVTGVSILSASPPGVFNAVTLSAVRSWRFRPSATGGSGTTTVRFKIR